MVSVKDYPFVLTNLDLGMKDCVFDDWGFGFQVLLWFFAFLALILGFLGLGFLIGIWVLWERLLFCSHKFGF